MAYRQLCAVTFALLGLVTIGCGGGTARAVPSDAEDSPPTNEDQAPNNTGDNASNPDRPRSNPDKAPSSSEVPAGPGGSGRLTALCDRICSTLDTIANDCNIGMSTGGMDEVCSGDVKCEIPANLPCQNEIADAFECLFENLTLICSDGGKGGPGGGKEEPCRDVTRALTQCTEGSEPVGNVDQPPCSAGGGCECPTECATCTCEAGTDATKLQACAEACVP